MHHFARQTLAAFMAASVLLWGSTPVFALSPYSNAFFKESWTKEKNRTKSGEECSLALSSFTLLKGKKDDRLKAMELFLRSMSFKEKNFDTTSNKHLVHYEAKLPISALLGAIIGTATLSKDTIKTLEADLKKQKPYVQDIVIDGDMNYFRVGAKDIWFGFRAVEDPSGLSQEIRSLASRMVDEVDSATFKYIGVDRASKKGQRILLFRGKGVKNGGTGADQYSALLGEGGKTQVATLYTAGVDEKTKEWRSMVADTTATIDLDTKTRIRVVMSQKCTVFPDSKIIITAPATAEIVSEKEGKDAISTALFASMLGGTGDEKPFSESLRDTRNSTRKDKVSAYVEALRDYRGDKKGLLPATIHEALSCNLPANEICKDGAESCEGLTDLSELKNGSYLWSIPEDPRTTSKNGSGYYVSKNVAGDVTVCAPYAEKGETIQETK